MHQWFRKGNARRFHRVDMPVRYFILPSSPLEEREIYASGADYFPSVIQKKIVHSKNDAIRSLSKLQNQKDLLTEIVTSVMADIEFYGNCLENISKGFHPKKDPQYSMQINGKLRGFESILKIKESSPKTYIYFQMIEEKFLAFLNVLVESINQSDQNNYFTNQELPFGFKLDETIHQFKHEKYAKIPLVRTILDLAELLECYLDVHRQIHDDSFLVNTPQNWPLQMASLSASGVAVKMPKLFKIYSRVNVFFYFEHADKQIRFEGNVVDIRDANDEYAERIAINFEFPNGADQSFIQQEIQKEEVRECMQFDLLSARAHH